MWKTSLILCSLMFANCSACVEQTKPVRSFATSDLVAVTMTEARKGCQFMKSEDTEVCARQTMTSALLAAICARGGVDGGAERCVSMTRVHGSTLMLETDTEILLVTDFGTLRSGSQR